MDRGEGTDSETFVFENRETIFKYIQALFDEKKFFDVTLVCNGEVIEAHRVVLTCYSPFFRKALQSIICDKPTIVFTDISKIEMMFLLDYIYKGRVSVPKDFMSSFMALLNKFGIQPPSNENNDADYNLEAHDWINNGTSSLSPILMELGQNLSSQCEEHVQEGETSTGKSKLRGESTGHGDGRKVVNPFARKARSSKGSDSSMHISPSLPTNKDHTTATSSPLNGDSDVEVIENNLPVLLVTDTQLSLSPHLCQSIREPVRAVVKSESVELTSDDSELAPRKTKNAAVMNRSRGDSDGSPKVSHSKKRRLAAVTDSPEEDCNAPPTVINPVAFRAKGRDEVATTSKDVPTTNVAVQKKMPFESYTTTPFRKIRKFCVVCQGFKRHIVGHIKRHHKKIVRVKRFVCRTCHRKFGIEKFLELHVCTK